MIRIVAINDESQNSDEDEVQVSKEAEVDHHTNIIKYCILCIKHNHND